MGIKRVCNLCVLFLQKSKSRYFSSAVREKMRHSNFKEKNINGLAFDTEIATIKKTYIEELPTPVLR